MWADRERRPGTMGVRAGEREEELVLPARAAAEGMGPAAQRWGRPGESLFQSYLRSLTQTGRGHSRDTSTWIVNLTLLSC